MNTRIANQCNTKQYAVECLCMFPCVYYSLIYCMLFILFLFYLLKGVILPFVRHSGEPHPLSRLNDIALAYWTISEAAGIF